MQQIDPDSAADIADIEQPEQAAAGGQPAPEADALGADAFDDAAKPLAASIAALTKRAGRLGRMPRLIEELDLFSARKLTDDMVEVLDQLSEAVDRLGDAVRQSRLDATDGDTARWAQQFEQALRAAEVPFSGRYPQYDVFPFYVKVDLAAGTTWINSRTGHVMRPAALAKRVRAEWEKVHKSAFNDQQFLKALFQVYDLLPKDLTRRASLRRAHEIMTVRTGAAAYPLRQFAFDLYRVRLTDMTAEGRRLVLNPSHTRAGAVPVPDGQGGVDNLGAFEVVPVDR